MDKLVFLEPDDIQEIPFTTSKIVAEHGNGYVYLIDNGTGKVKIGRTTNPMIRIKTIESQSGMTTIQTYVSPQCSNYKDLELITHKKFDEFRVKGEWFKISFNEVKDHISSLHFEMISTEKEVADASIFPKGKGPEYVALETELLNILNTKMQSLREKVAVSKALYGSISSSLRQEVTGVILQFDNLEADFERQISVLMDLGNDYHTIKDILMKKYLEAKPA